MKVIEANGEADGRVGEGVVREMTRVMKKMTRAVRRWQGGGEGAVRMITGVMKRTSGVVRDVAKLSV